MGGYSLIVGEGHESCKHSKFWLSPLNLPGLPTAALRHSLNIIAMLMQNGPLIQSQTDLLAEVISCRTCRLMNDSSILLNQYGLMTKVTRLLFWKTVATS